MNLTDENVMESDISESLEMSSNETLEIQSPENGCCGSLQDVKSSKKNLKSSVITTEGDQLKIKLKISKKDIGGDGNGRKEGLEAKLRRNNLSEMVAEVKNGDEKLGDESVSSSEERLLKGNSGEVKMKLRSKKEAQEEVDNRKEEIEEYSEERKRRRETWSEKEAEKPLKKRGKPMRYQEDEGLEKPEEGTRRRSRRNDGEIADTMKPSSVEEIVEGPNEVNKESFCWTCHKDKSVVKCDTCPRVFHLKCVSLTKDPSKDWICPECSLVLHAEKMSTRSEAMKSLSLDQLCTLLSFAIGRMKNVPESQAFWKPVDPKEVPFYDKYITNPMDLNLLERNMKAKMYGSPQAFLADAKWLLHNSIIFNSTQSPLTSTARFLVKICRQEMAEIENCPDCYLNAHTKEDWFIEVCRKPHILIWARLKGFPFWPAKAMSTNLKTQHVDARFFGAHDKAWVPVKECYLYSKNSPQVLSKKRADLDDAFLEVEGYIKKIRQKFGTFCYAPDKTPFMPEMYDKQLQSLIPNYREDRSTKKKRKGGEQIGENGIFDKPLQNGKKVGDNGGQRFKLKRPGSEEGSKIVGHLCLVNDYVSEEKIASDDRISPEDEIARSLEMYDTHGKVEGEAGDDNSTDLDEDGSVPIPEHGYSRVFGESEKVQSSSGSSCQESADKAVEESENKEVEGSEPQSRVAGEDCMAESSENAESSHRVGEEREKEKEDSCINDQCEVSSTSADIKVIQAEERKEEMEQVESEPSNTEARKTEATGKTTKPTELTRKEEDRSQKSFVNLTVDQKQKILTEAKLLANIDEMTALGKQKVLNDLGLDASQVDIRQMAQENRQILETLTKKCQSEDRGFEEVAIKSEDFEQYLIEENSEENVFRENEEEEEHSTPKLGTIKVRDFNTLTKGKSGHGTSDKSSTEPMLKIMDVQSLRDLKQTIKEPRMKRRKSMENPLHSKKLKLEPVIELIKLDAYDKSVEKLNRKLRLSDEVSLLMVDGEKKGGEEMDRECGKKTALRKPPRARKSIPNRAKSRETKSASISSGSNINVISVDTENSTAQKNLLKSLCLEEKKPEDTGRKTVLITTNEKGIKNVDVKNTCDVTVKKQVKEVTIEAVKETVKSGEIVKDGSSGNQKNVTVMANSHLIVTNNGPTLLTNQSAQSNLALAQNNLGQLSLVHLTNLTSGIQTNFVNLTNETIGFNNPVGALYASPGFNSEFPPSSASSGSVILAPTLTTALSSPGSGVGASPGPCSGTPGIKGGSKPGAEVIKLPVNRVGSSKPTSGISVKSPASLGLVTSQPNKLPPLIAIPGEGMNATPGEVGSVTAELNKHSIKMAEYMRATIEDILRELSNQGSLEAKYKLLTIEMEKLQWRHQQEIMELKHHSERSIMELRNTLESDKQKCLGELKAQLESQHQKVISETKRKQWCANCGKEALFYCCWNTSYCDYPCQQQHWPGHMSTCAQLGNNVTIGSTSGSQLQNKTPGIKYQNSGYVPIISRGGGGGGGGGNNGSNGGNSGGGSGSVSVSGSHSGGPFASNRALPTVQRLLSSYPHKGLLLREGKVATKYLCTRPESMDNPKFMSNFNPVTHVIFDLDGLLLDTEVIYKQVITNIVESYGKKYTSDIQLKVLGTTEQATAEIVVKECKLPISVNEFLQEFRRLQIPSLGNAKLMQGAERLVIHLHENKVPIAVATSSGERSVAVKTKNYRNFFELFHHIVMGSSDPDVKKGKPAPDIFLICAQRFKDKPDYAKCLVFEDAPNGVKGARAAGMQAVMVPETILPPEKTKDATLIINSLLDFKPEDFGLPPFKDKWK